MDFIMYNSEDKFISEIVNSIQQEVGQGVNHIMPFLLVMVKNIHLLKYSSQTIYIVYPT